jgi:LmbE family N-acetylglucosaminyl deacetylase
MSGVPASALVITAHPDDCEFGCGGTIAKWARAGAAVKLIVLTDGSKGSHDPELADSDLRDLREREQRAAADTLGLTEVRFARQVDGELSEDPALVVFLAAAIRELTPEVVITHDPWRMYDMHPDHLVAGRLVRSALFSAREPRAVRELAAEGLNPWRPRELLLFHPQEADHVEDVSATFDLKIEALLCHRTQYVTSFGIRGLDGDRDRFIDAVRAYAQSTAAGREVLGESFRRIALIRHTS